jgi:hypothetical protein
LLKNSNKEQLVVARPARDAFNAATDGFAVFHGLYWLTANVAERRGLVVTADDVE